MNFWSIYNELLFIVTLAVAEIIVCSRFKKRKFFVLRMILGLIPAVVINHFWFDVIKGSDVAFWVGFRYLMIFALSYIFIVNAYKGKLWSYLFAGIMAYCMQHIAYQTHSLFCTLFSFARSSWFGMLMIVLNCLLWYGGVYFVFIRKIKKDEILNIQNKMQILISGAVLIITAFLCIYGVFSIAPENKTALIVFFLFSDFSCLFAISLQVSVLKLKETEVELAVLKHMVHEAKYQFLNSKESIEVINIKCHDLRHQLAALKNKLDEEELSKLSDAVDIYDNDFKTGNDALDVVLTEKGLICKEKNVRLTCMINGKNLENMKSSDIYALFGNAIENALESVEKLEEDRRVISLIESDKDSYFAIRIENYCDGQVDFEDGLPVTKKNKNYHGFGVKSMRLIAEKYGGKMYTSLKDNIFRVDILLPHC